MAPAAKSASKKSSGSAATHGSYQEMIKIAIINLKERKGSSRQALKKYIRANNSLGATTDAAFNSHINRALTVGEEQGVFERPKGPSGPVKLKKPAVGAAKPEKKEAPKKAAPEKKASTAAKPKKASDKASSSKPTTKKASATKANTKKKATAAPAVEEKPAVILGKTKSGRITKTIKAPETVKRAAPKKAPAKKASAAKAATPKKDTPKKDTPAA